jgi:hypothetical protein
MRSLAILVFPLMLAGCMTAQEKLEQSQARAAKVQAEAAQQDDERCLSFGAKPGTESYITCRTRLQAARISVPPPTQAPTVVVQSAAPVPNFDRPPPVTCMRTGNMTTCN